MKTMNDNAQMMVLEAIIFAITVLLSLVFLYQLSPASTVEYKYTTDLKLQGDDALRSLNNAPIPAAANYPRDFPSNKLVYYLITNNYSNFITDLNSMLPKTVDYNLYISNGTTTIFWCHSNYNPPSPIPEEPLKTIEPVSKSHYVIAIDPLYRTNETFIFSHEVQQGKYGSNERSDLDHSDAFGGYSGSSYDVIVELWSIP